MMRQSSSRNQRGWKVKHVLQICVLVAVCVWLVYQVKQSQDKKKALEERNSKLSDRVEEDRADFLKLGRKDPHGNSATITTESTTHNEEAENKEAEVAAGGENKGEEKEEEGRGTGDGNEIEENNQERADEEAEVGEESGSEEAKEGRSGDPGSSDNEDHGGADGNSQEAREEHYKADDASSAVVRDTQEIDQENESLGTENSEEQKENTEQEELENGDRTNVTEDASKDGEVDDVPVDDESQQNNSTSFMETAIMEREPEVGNTSNSAVALESAGHIEEHSSIASDSNDEMEQQNNLTTFEPDDQIELQNNSTGSALDEQVETQSASGGVDADTADSTLENATVDMASAQDQNTLNEMGTLREDNSNSENNSTVFEPNDLVEQQNNTTGTVSYKQVKTQTMPGGVIAETVVSTPETLSVDLGSAQDQNSVNDGTTLIEGNSNSQNIPPEQTKKSDQAGAADGSDERPKTSSSTDENGDAVQGEATSSSGNAFSVTEEEGNARTDLSTLPEVEAKSVEA